MAVVIDSKKDKNSYACRHNFGGVYINGEFMKDGTEVPRSVLNGMTTAQRERYTKTVASAPKKTQAKPKATAKKSTAKPKVKPTAKKTTPAPKKTAKKTAPKRKK